MKQVTTATRIGFIGLGIMGKPMALNLRKAGYALWVYGRRPTTMEPLIAAGATACRSAAEVAAATEVIIVMVADTPDVEAALFAPDGIAGSARPGSVLIDMSTIAPQATRGLAKRLATQGVEMLDAPVSGGEIGAIQATLSIMVGGKPTVFEAVRPLLAAMGKNIVHVGDHGAGQVAKAANQIIVGLTIEAVAEALTLARESGVDPARVREALMGGFAGSRILEVHGERMLKGDFTPGFKVRLHRKDMRIALEAGQERGLGLPGAALVADQFDALMAQGDGELDHAALVKIAAKKTGSPAD